MEPVIKVSNLTQKLGRRIFFQNISFQVLPGECFGIFGTRGSGKSSLLHILAGIDRFTSGQVEVLGSDISRSESYKEKLGLVTQVNSLFQDLTVGENLDFIASLKKAPQDAIREMTERFELGDFLAEPVTSLAKRGVLQRLALACAMLNNPQLLVADEMMADIDLYSRSLMLKELRRFLTEGGCCVWAFSHIEFCSYVNRVGWLEDGKLTFYEPQAARGEWMRQEKFYLEPGDKDHV